MPQLNPAPWLFILLFSWLIFLTIITSKVLTHLFTNNLNALTLKNTEKEPWTWPWL